MTANRTNEGTAATPPQFGGGLLGPPIGPQQFDSPSSSGRTPGFGPGDAGSIPAGEASAASLHEQAEQRVYTNDLDALEALIVGGLPPDEMQAAAWVLVQRVRGLQGDLMRVEKARAAWAARAAR